MPTTKATAPEWGTEVFRMPDVARVTLERRGVVARPYPPDGLGDDAPEGFVPDWTFAEWIRETFIHGGGPLANEDHAHLMDAALGVLWTNAVNRRQMRHVIATAEIPQAMSGGWKRARHDYQLRQWFDVEPQFLLTFSAPDCLRLDDVAFCALVEHELYHCAQALDAFGGPKFNGRTGEPVFAMRGHDVEEFVGVVRRYGVTTPEVRELVHAAAQTPLIAGASIAQACGTCLARAA
ncbi:putative metallopeptidase [soil metagenome]